MPSNIFQDARYIQKHPCKKFTLKNEMQQKSFEDMKGHYQHFGVAFVKLRKRDIFIERMRKKSTTNEEFGLCRQITGILFEKF